MEVFLQLDNALGATLVPRLGLVELVLHLDGDDWTIRVLQQTMRHAFVRRNTNRLTWYGLMNSETASIYGVQASKNPVSLVRALAGIFVNHPGNPPPASVKVSQGPFSCAWESLLVSA